MGAAAEMLSALAACNVRHNDVVACRKDPVQPGAPNAGRRACPRVLAVVPRDRSMSLRSSAVRREFLTQLLEACAYFVSCV